MSERVRTLVVDDDAMSRSYIRGLIDTDPALELIGECADGAEAVERIRADQPDLLFLDVQMPNIDGFGVVEEIGAANMPVTMFVSAYVDFALRAFEAYALDYLLKPFDEERFRTAAQRAKDAVAARRIRADPRLAALLSFLHGPAPQTYPETLAVKSGEQYHFVRVADIDYIEADGNHIRLVMGKAQRTLYKSLADMVEKVLDPGRFVRIHRSTIVNIARIAVVEPLSHGDLSVGLVGGKRLVCTRRFRPKLQERVHFTT